MRILLLMFSLLQVVVSEEKTVQFQPGPVAFTEEGKTLILSCSVNVTANKIVIISSENLNPKVEFYSVGTEERCKKGSDSYLFSCDVSKGKYRLTIYNVSLELHNAKFTCVTSNGFGMRFRDTVKIAIQVPVIAIEPDKTVSVKDGEEINITCKTKVPKYNITWFLIDGYIESALPDHVIQARYRVTEYDLIIKNVITYAGRMEDNGKHIYCKLVDDGADNLTLSSSKCELDVKYGPNLKVPWFNIPGSKLLVEKGQSAPNITCNTPCNPECSFGWTEKDGKFIQSPVLVIGEIDENQIGQYMCYAVNDIGIGNKSMVLEMAYGPRETMMFDTNVTDVEVFEDDVIPNITCSADCNPRCSFNWSLPSNDTVFGEVLSLQKLSLNSSGEYVCYAGNDFGSGSNSFRVNLQYGPQTTIKLDINTNDLTAVRGSKNPNVTCIADCNPECETWWSYGWNNTINSTILHLDDVITLLPENFICHASNMYGSANVTLFTTIGYPPEDVSINSKPIITLDEGQNIAHIRCTANCNPVCDYKWVSDDLKTLSNSPVLVPGTAKPSVAGLYICVAQNIHGTAKTNLSVFVNYRRMRIAQSNIRCPNNKTGSTVTLTCKVDTYPSGFVFLPWIHNYGSQFIRTLNGSLSSKTNVLTLPFCGYQDTGTYICKVDFGVNGTKVIKEASSNVTVEDKPVITNYVVKTLAPDHSSLTISIKFYSVPKPKEITWLKDGKELSLSDRIRQLRDTSHINLTFYESIVAMKGYVSDLMIAYPDSRNDGLYTLKVTNDRGYAEQEVKVSDLNSKINQIEYAAIVVGLALALIVLGISVVYCCHRRKRKRRDDRRKKQEIVRKRRKQQNNRRTISSYGSYSGSYTIHDLSVYDEINDDKEAESILYRLFSKKKKSPQVAKENAEYIEPITLEMQTIQRHGLHSIFDIQDTDSAELRKATYEQDNVSYACDEAGGDL